MLNQTPPLKESPSQTAGPYVHIGMTPSLATARRLALVWGVHAVVRDEVSDAAAMSELACRTAVAEGHGHRGQTVVIAAGMPFGTSGTTNLLRIAQID